MHYNTRPSIAIIGSGISGLGAAYLLQHRFNVTVFEKNNYAGGHSNTVEVAFGANKIAVDTGFIVFNKRTYPHLVAMFEHLGVAYEKSNMSFSVSKNDGGFEYSSTFPVGFLAQKRNLLNVSFLKMTAEILRFNKLGTAFITDPQKSRVSDEQKMGDFLVANKFSGFFWDHYVAPLISAIWSCPQSLALEFPARTFLTFFHNHGLLTVFKHPQWYTVSGGSREYVKKITTQLSASGADVLLNSAVEKVWRANEKDGGKEGEKAWGKVCVKLVGNPEIKTFDKLIFACHGDQASAALQDKSSQEQAVLGGVKYQPNRVVLHSDPSLMPVRPKAWASWNYFMAQNDGENNAENNGEATNSSSFILTYWMNNLQNIPQQFPLYVTVNPPRNLDHAHAEFSYEHPVYNAELIHSQHQFPSIQGQGGIYYAGAYQRYGFHEDGLHSAVKVAEMLGVSTPWMVK
jgi:predicted NAD/FAD-binding protein